MPDKVTATAAALELLAEIVADHGPVLFHQSGGCCDGSPPMCYPQSEFLIGDNALSLAKSGVHLFISAARNMRFGNTPTSLSTSFPAVVGCFPSTTDGSVGS